MLYFLSVLSITMALANSYPSSLHKRGRPVLFLHGSLTVTPGVWFSDSVTQSLKDAGAQPLEWRLDEDIRLWFPSWPDLPPPTRGTFVLPHQVAAIPVKLTTLAQALLRQGPSATFQRLVSLCPHPHRASVFFACGGVPPMLAASLGMGVTLSSCPPKVQAA